MVEDVRVRQAERSIVPQGWIIFEFVSLVLSTHGRGYVEGIRVKLV